MTFPSHVSLKRKRFAKLFDFFSSVKNRTNWEILSVITGRYVRENGFFEFHFSDYLFQSVLSSATL